jgi:hypothetical protein
VARGAAASPDDASPLQRAEGAPNLGGRGRGILGELGGRREAFPAVTTADKRQIDHDFPAVPSVGDHRLEGGGRRSDEGRRRA